MDAPRQDHPGGREHQAHYRDGDNQAIGAVVDQIKADCHGPQDEGELADLPQKRTGNDGGLPGLPEKPQEGDVGRRLDQ